MSKIKVNSLEGVGASTPAITIDNSSGTCTANLTNRKGKNLVVNGAMKIAQRQTSSTSSSYQTVDMVEMHYSGTDEAPTQAQVDVASGTTPYTLGFRKAFSITNGNQTSGAGTADYIWIQMHQEAQNIANSGWNYLSSSSNITLSFWIKSSVAQDFKGYLRSKDSTNYMYPFATGSLSADTWTKVTKTISGNSNLVFNNDNEAGMQINILAFYGTDVTDNSVTENAWATYSSSARMKDNTSTWYTTNDATLQITGVQLEVSDHATDFEHLSFAEDLRKCQRYFFRVPYQGVSNGGGVYLGSGKETGSNARVAVVFPVPMRALPACAASNLLADDESSATSANTVSSVLGSTVEPDRARVEFSGGSYSGGNSISLATGQTTNSYLEGSAEL
jgi:hypothetical protein